MDSNPASLSASCLGPVGSSVMGSNYCVELLCSSTRGYCLVSDEISRLDTRGGFIDLKKRWWKLDMQLQKH